MISRLAPLLDSVADRLVLCGRVAADRHLTDPRLTDPATRSVTLADPVMRALSSWTLDRLAPALIESGWERVQRSPTVDHWSHRELAGTILSVEYVAGGGDAAEAWREYASLLTVAVPAEPPHVRVASPVATLALLLADWLASGTSALDSVSLEDALLLLAGRPELATEIAMAPPELRDFVREALTRLARYRGVTTVLLSATPGARRQPALARRAGERLRALAGIAQTGTESRSRP